MRCSRCGSDVPESSRYCSSCGLDLQPSAPRAAVNPSGDASIAGEALRDEYEIHEELGRGGMAIVYRATERALEREVAIKVLPAAFTFDAEFVERFQREARTAARLEHPNIVPVYRVGDRDRVIFFVMKYLRGGSLATLMARRGRLPASEIRRILTETGAALGYAAQRGVVHRDIKPDNIMFDEFGKSHLADFGIARAVSGTRLTGTGLSIGTPHYMSPEQARAQETDGRSDLYSLGVVAYECLTGRVPYDGDDAFAIGYKHITEPLPVPALTDPDDLWLFRTIERMLEKDPADRFQSCEDLLASLNRRVPSTTPTVPTPMVTPPARRAQAATAAAVSDPAATPRSVASRSATLRRPAPRASGWVWPLVALLAAGAVATYYVVRQQASAPGPQPIKDSTALPIAALDTPAVDGVAADPATSESLPVAPRATSGAAGPPTRAVPRDSGALRLRDLPLGSSVMINGKEVSAAVTRLPSGPNAIGISAPRHVFYTDTVRIVAGETLTVAPSLTRLGAGERRSRPATTTPSSPARAAQPASVDPCQPGAGYSAPRCFDQRPRPLSAPLVVRPDGVPETVEASLYWVRVGADGSVNEVRLLKSSGDGAFDVAAREVALAGWWQPAQKDGAPITAWTQMSYRPVVP